MSSNKISTEPDLTRPPLGGLSSSAMRQPKTTNPPSGNTGGIPGQGAARPGHPNPTEGGFADNLLRTSSTENKGDPDASHARVARNTIQPATECTPPLKSGSRRSRARKTTLKMAKFLDDWFFDWMTLTMPNPQTGKGQRLGGDEGRAIDGEATASLMRWARSQNLWRLRVAGGTDGYGAAAHLGLDPTDRERLVSIRSGHATNMPGAEISGGDGQCHDLALSARRLLGPVLVARADVTQDFSREGLWDELLEYARSQVGAGAGKGLRPPRVFESETGRTFYFGSDGVSVRVYEKDLERVAKGKLALENADPNLVRVEFTFRPESRRKAAFGDLDPGEMLCTSRWARAMVEHLAVLVEVADEGENTLAKREVERMPDASTVQDRADHMMRQSMGSVVKAAASHIVHERFDGDWEAAAKSGELDSDELRSATLYTLTAGLDVLGTVDLFLLNGGIHALRYEEDLALAMSIDLENYITDQADRRDVAKRRLCDALADAGVQACEPDVGHAA